MKLCSTSSANVGADPVAQVCAAMGFPSPVLLRRYARLAAELPPLPGPRTPWPVDFVPQLHTLMAKGSRHGESETDRKQAATERREAFMREGKGWCNGTAIKRPDDGGPVSTAPKRIARQRDSGTTKRGFTWRGHSVAYLAWCHMEQRGEMTAVDIAEALAVEVPLVRRSMVKPVAAGVIVRREVQGELPRFSVGPTKVHPPATAGSRRQAPVAVA